MNKKLITGSNNPQLKAYWRTRLGVTAWQHPTGILTSRRLRKGHGPLTVVHFKRLSLRSMTRALCHPKQLNRLEVLTSLAFIVGPLLFAIGSLWSLMEPGSVEISSATLAMGSVFFTAGGWWQLRQAQIAVEKLPAETENWQWCGLRCALTQSMGTVLFNINTFFLWGWAQPNDIGWLLLAVLPNLLGSILFLISAADGLIEVGHGKLLVYEPNHLGWWIAMVNGLGCLWFMQSALAALPNHLPEQSVFNADMAARTTFLGSLAFAVVGLLSLAECSEDEITST
ncbi:hypothetical protein MITS9509_00438 [Synechococcus sp. MIT S9509]|nr:hypothetical protein MITS9509_00438 [Synechococcus sp. MIT S9509]